MTTEPETDAEIVAWIREQMQELLNQACKAYDGGKTFAEFSDEAPLPSEDVVVYAVDLREIGAFKLDIPKDAPRKPTFPLRHWVYMHRKTGTVYAIHWPNRMLLQTMGFAPLHAFVNDPTKRN